jgi:Protein of unknown function (DUF2938)
MEATMLAEITLRILLIGAGATIVMDAWLFLLKRIGAPTMSFAFLGRWVGHLPRGTWAHDGIAKAAPIKSEALLGWITHYAVGIAFAALLLWVEGLEWARAPTLLPALLTGVATVVVPLLILQPAMGAGIASSKTPTQLLNSCRSVLTHAVFGVGLYLAALASASWA